MRIVAIIQARLKSSRFPEKVLREIGYTTIISRIVDTASYSNVNNVILAVPYGEKKVFSEAIDISYSDKKVTIFEGAENDVLGRFYAAASSINADVVVRLCGDNPFVSSFEINAAIERWQQLSNKYDTVLVCDGGYVEVFSFNLLKALYELDLTAYDREHVTSIVTERGVTGAEALGWHIEYFQSLSINTPQDLERVQKWYDDSNVVDAWRFNDD